MPTRTTTATCAESWATSAATAPDLQTARLYPALTTATTSVAVEVDTVTVMVVLTVGTVTVVLVTNRGTNVTGDKRYHGIYVVHQTERVVLSDCSVLRHDMSQTG